MICLREHLLLHLEELTDTKWVIRIRISDDRKHNVQKDKQRSIKHKYKTIDRVTWTPLTTGGDIRCPWRMSSSCPTSGTHCVTLVPNPVMMFLFWKSKHSIIVISMLSVNIFCNISSYDILAYITKNYIALTYYAKIVHLLCQFHAGKVGFSAVCPAIYS
jgi:hypothetical protein